MPESEEDLRRYLREKIAEEKRADDARLGRGRMIPWLSAYNPLPAPDPLYGDLSLGEEVRRADDTPDVEASAPPPAPLDDDGSVSTTITPVPETPPRPAPLPPPLAAVPAAPPAAAGPIVPLILRGIAIFGLVTAVGAIALLAQRSGTDPKAWLGVGVGLAVSATLLFLAGRKPSDPGNPPIVR